MNASTPESIKLFVMAGLLTYLCLTAFPFMEQWHQNDQASFREIQQRVLSAIFTLFPFNLLSLMKKRTDNRANIYII